jgi:restriction system protein
MTIPTYEELMKPILEQCSDGRVYSLKDTVNNMAEYFSLTDEEVASTLPSGQQTYLHNRVSWAISYMVKAKLLDRPKRAHIKITDRGISELKNNDAQITREYLKKYDEFVAFINKDTTKTKASLDTVVQRDDEATPDEQLEISYQQLHESLVGEIQEAVANTEPAQFEQLVVDLLLAMGYGGSFREAGQAIGRSGDEGIDGIIKEDRLGLDVIYLQAKRWTNNIGRPQIQQFAGALMGKKAKKGVFITTSAFSNEALAYAKSLDSKLILIDGRELANLMIEHGVGVSIRKTFHLKRIDTDYFEME